MDGYSFSSFTEMVVTYFPRAIMLFIGVAVGIALYDSLKPARPPFGRMWARATSRLHSPRR